MPPNISPSGPSLKQKCLGRVRRRFPATAERLNAVLVARTGQPLAEQEARAARRAYRGREKDVAPVRAPRGSGDVPHHAARRLGGAWCDDPPRERRRRLPHEPDEFEYFPARQGGVKHQQQEN